MGWCNLLDTADHVMRDLSCAKLDHVSKTAHLGVKELGIGEAECHDCSLEELKIVI